MIPKGKYDWYSPDKGLTDEASQVFNRFANLKELPSIPTAIMELQELLQDPDVAVAQVVKTLRRNPAIATEVLANGQRMKSAKNPLDKPIDSLEHAIVYIGMKELYQIVQASALATFKTKTQTFNTRNFWRESYLIGSIAECLRDLYNVSESSDEVYLSGSLCNIGKLVAALSFPEKIDAIAQDCRDPKTAAPWAILEMKHDVVDHTILGEVGAAFWGFPDYVIDSARYHHTYPLKDNVATQHTRLISLIALSNQLAHWALFQPERVDKDLLDGFRSDLGLSEKEIEEVYEKKVIPLLRAPKPTPSADESSDTSSGGSSEQKAS